MEVRTNCFQEVGLCFYHTGSGNWTCVIRLACKPLYPLSRLNWQNTTFLKLSLKCLPLEIPFPVLLLCSDSAVDWGHHVPPMVEGLPQTPLPLPASFWVTAVVTVSSLVLEHVFGLPTGTCRISLFLPLPNNITSSLDLRVSASSYCSHILPATFALFPLLRVRNSSFLFGLMCSVSCTLLGRLLPPPARTWL